MQYNGLFYESARLEVSNPISDFSRPVEESVLADLRVSEVRAIYPLIRAINSGRLTRNYTFYPQEALIGKNDPADPTGFSSFVKPYGKPILREHKSSASFNGDADIPMGRVVYAGYKTHENINQLAPKNKHFPGTVEGDGALFLVPAITHPESIVRVLGRSDQTVSIGARVDSVKESISNLDIAQLAREGKELPAYEKGQIYNNKLSYWSMGPIKGIECSFVNVPSDEYAGVVDPNIGVEGIRLMVGQKKQGVKEFNFFDAKTEQEIKLDLDFSEYDDSYFVDSNKSHSIWWLNKEMKLESTHQESVSEEIMKIEINKENLLNFEELSKLKDQENFLEELVSITTAQELEDELLEVREELLKETVTFIPSNVEKFQELQDKYVELVGEWNETAITLATLAFVNEGETFKKPEPKEDPNKLLTFGELYSLDSEDEDFAKEAKLSTDARNKLPDSAFCKPDTRGFPVHDKAHAVAALRLLNRYKGSDKAEIKACIHRKAQKYGVGIKGESDITLFPLVVEYFANKEQHIYTPIKISSVEEADNILSNLKDVAANYSLDESQTEDLKKFVEESKEILTNPLFENESEIIPLSLPMEFFINYFEQTENSNNHKYLAGFVGLIRKNKIDKQTVEAAIESYNIFGSSILKKWAEEIPVVKEEKVEETESIPSVETIPDLTAATAETQEGNHKQVESKRPWYSGLDLGAKKSSKVKIKEKGV